MTESALKIVEGQITAIDQAAHKITLKNRDGQFHEMFWTAAYNGKLEKLQQWWFTKITAEKSGEYWKIAAVDFFKRPEDWPFNKPATGGSPSIQKAIIFQSTLKVVAEVYCHCTAFQTQDFDEGIELIYGKTKDLTDRIMRDAGVQ